MMKRTQHNKAFTIVELLTVMAVIALLIGLLVPALAMVKDKAKDIQQRAQFHSIGIGLEMFKSDFGDYPESNDNVDVYDNTKNHPLDPTPYSGANKLAEAMVGLDYLGFHPNSDFRSTGQNTVTLSGGGQALSSVYTGIAAPDPLWQTPDENIKARKGPYVETENANAFRMDEVYTATHLAFGTFRPFSLVLCDVYAKKRNAVNSRKTGNPILYYRARTSWTLQDYTDGLANDIFYYPDNENILSLRSADDTTASLQHRLYDSGGSSAAGDLEDFEDAILNRNIPGGTGIQRPYRAGSFILISAGKDGVFGTADDIFNFTREAE